MQPGRRNSANYSFEIIIPMRRKAEDNKGMIMLTTSATIDTLRPPPCTPQANTSHACTPSTHGQQAFLFISMALISLGTGGIKPNIAIFGADQFDEDDDKEALQKYSFFSWFFFIINTGALLAITVLVGIREYKGWSWGFAVPTACMLSSILILVAGYRRYRFKKPLGSALTRFFQVVVAAVRNHRRGVQEVGEGDRLYEVKGKESAILGARKIGHTAQYSNRWRLCTVTQVEELKSFIRVLPIWATTIALSLSFGPFQTFFVSQAAIMDRKIGPTYVLPAGTVPVFGAVNAVLLVPLYEKLIVPVLRRYTGHRRGITSLQRMGVGLFISIFAMVSAALTEKRRRDDANPSAMSVFWLFPQFFLLGSAEVFTYVGQLEFFYDQASDGTRSLFNALFLTGIGLSAWINTALLKIIQAATGGEEMGWVRNDLNKSRLDNFYWVLATIDVVNFFAYLVVAMRFKGKDVDSTAAGADGWTTAEVVRDQEAESGSDSEEHVFVSAIPHSEDGLRSEDSEFGKEDSEFGKGDSKFWIEFAERLAFYSVAVSLVNYLVTEMNQTLPNAATNVTDWIGAGSVLALLGAFLADAYFGRFKIIISFSCFYATGLVLLTLSASIDSLRPTKCPQTALSTPPCISPPATRGQNAFLFLALGLIALGTGGIKACVSSLGADQFDESDKKEARNKHSFFNWFFVALSMGMLLGITLLVYLQQQKGLTWGYAAPSAVMVCCGVVLGSGFRYYRFLDKAAVMVDPEQAHGNNRWNLCTVTQVEEFKSFIRVLPVWASTTAFFISFCQIFTFFITQATVTDRHLGSAFLIPPGSVPIFAVNAPLLTPIYEKLIVPLLRRKTGHPHGITSLQRMGVGLLVSIFGTASAALVERMRQVHYPEPFTMSVFWLSPQYFLIGSAMFFMYVGQLEFFYDEATDGTRSISNAMFLSEMGIGSWLSTVIVKVVQRATGGVHKGWLQNSLDTSRFDYFYWVLTGINAVNFLVYLLVAVRYKGRNVNGAYYSRFKSDQVQSHRNSSVTNIQGPEGDPMRRMAKTKSKE
ncbi:hypothetical protein RHGRI_016010 [Rhododendron griersonianum]|uniref:Uncharacterized protein n=1 Tax=Rhododendron griersonianum TaxID=479676 RepID=A0AAV6JSQ7_9ERIC|nr:hypothetical protein RHGRI_016010 [Rhododendron griersonianum]